MNQNPQKNTHAIKPLADDFTTLFESPDPQRLFAYSPGIVRLASGRLVATIDLGGPGIKEWPGLKWERPGRGDEWQGRVYSSDDHGLTWTHRAEYPFMHARPL